MTNDTFEREADRMLRLAEEAAANCADWTDIYNAVTAPGIASEAFPNRADRERFIKSPQYERIVQMADAVRKAGREGLPSGKFLVRLPRSLHAALAREAKEEGVSLNQLVVSRLSAPPRQAAA